MKGWYVFIIVAALVMSAGIAMALTMQGYTYDAGGNWLSNVQISCSNSMNTYDATSGQDGHYSIQGMESGKYTCHAYHSGYYSDYREIDLQTDYQRIDFYLPVVPPTQGNLKGHVFDSSNRPLSGITVKCGNYYSTTTDSDGFYIIYNMTAGSYTCSADNQDHSSVRIEAGQTAVHNFYISTPTPPPAQGSIKGYTYYENSPLSGVYVVCGQYSGYSNNAGYYEIDLPEGYYSCSFVSQYGTKYWSGYVSDTYVNIYFSSNPAPQTYRVYGYVNTPDGHASGANVVCNGKSDVADSSGYYEIDGLSGQVSCSYSLSGFRTEYWSGYLSSDTRVDMLLQPAQTQHHVYGYVKTSSGSPLSGVLVDCDGLADSTDSSGYYSVPASGFTTCHYTKAGYDEKTWSGFVYADRQVDIVMDRAGYSLSGYVYSESGKRLYGATVSCDGNSDNTNLFGYYSIPGLYGTVECTADAPGYFSKSVSLNMYSNRNYDFYLVERNPPIPKYNLYGTVYGNGNPVSYSVTCEGPETLRQSGYGSYSLDMKKGDYVCTFHSNGYIDKKMKIYLYHDKKLDVNLEKQCSYGFYVKSRQDGNDVYVTVNDQSNCLEHYSVIPHLGCAYAISDRSFDLQGGSKTVKITLDSSCSGYVDVSGPSTKTVWVSYNAPDNIPPVLNVYYQHDVEYGEKFKIIADAHDNSGISKIEISGLKTCRSNHCEVVDSIYAGQKSYVVRAWDNNGNMATKSFRIYSHQARQQGSVQSTEYSGSYLHAVEIRELIGTTRCISCVDGWERWILLAILVLVLIIVLLLLSSLISGRK